MATLAPTAEAPLDQEENPKPPRDRDLELAPPLHPAAAVGDGPRDVLATYVGASFAVFLGLLPALSSSSVQTRCRSLAVQLARAEEQIRQMRARRKEDCRANARVVEIFAGHRSQWQKEWRRLVGEVEALKGRLEGVERERDGLREEVERLRREVEDREEVIEAMSRDAEEEEEARSREEEEVDEEEEDFVEKEVEMASGKGGGGVEVRSTGFKGNNNAYAAAIHRKVDDPDEEERDYDHGAEAAARYHDEYDDLGYTMPVTRFAMPRRRPLHGSSGGDSPGNCFYGASGELGPEAAAAAAAYYAAAQRGAFGSDYFSPGIPKSWGDKNQGLQERVHESLEALYPTKHFVLRRQSPWKVDGESSGVSSKLKLVEQELESLEKVSTTSGSGSVELSKVQASMRKHAKRYQSLARKVDDLCKRMQASDPSEPTLSPEFRSQRQTDFLVEAHRLQQRASETRQKMMSLQVEAATCLTTGGGDDKQQQQQLAGKARTTTKKSLDSIKANFKEIQRSLEVWVARIMGDVEGIMAREGASRVNDYYLSRYPVR